jgi:hypothetical protein
MLDVMRPSVARAAGASKKFFAMYFGNGTPRTALSNEWTSTISETATGMTLGKALSPLESNKSDIVVLNNLYNEPYQWSQNTTGLAFNTGHWMSTSAFLTGQVMDAAAVQNNLNVSKLAMPGQSLDWMLAQALGQEPLIMGVDGRAFGAGNDPRGNEYMFFTTSWKSQTQCIEHKATSLEVWNTLFSNFTPSGAGPTPEQLAAAKHRTSVLHSVSADIRRLKQRLPAADQARLDEHLTTIEEVEKSVALETSLTCTSVPSSTGYENNINDGSQVNLRAKNMIDMAVLAFSCGLRNVATLHLQTDQTGGPDSRYLSNSGGKSYLHHPVSHYTDYGDTSAALEGMLIFNQWQTTQLAYLIQRLKATPDVGGTLFDNTIAMLGCGLGDSASHTPLNIPMILAGGGGGTLKTGRSVDCSKESIANMLLAIAQKMGLNANSFGRSSRVMPMI